MSSIKNYKDLRIWQQGMLVVKEIYIVLKVMPKDEMFGLTNQLKRASVSIPSNIAEGQARGTKEFAHFLRIALGSLSEVETQLLLTVNLEMISKDKVEPILVNLESLAKQINSLRSKLITKHQLPTTNNQPLITK